MMFVSSYRKKFQNAPAVLSEACLLYTSKEYVLILSDRGAPLSPIMVIPVENGKLTSSFLPEEIEDNQKEMDVAEYLDLLKEAAQ